MEQSHDCDHASVAELIKTHYSGLTALMRRKLKDRELASDLVNEAIAVTLEHLKDGRVGRPEQIAGYVFKVAMNLLRNHQRNFDNRRELRSDVGELERHMEVEPDEIEAAQLRAKAQKVIDSLTSPRDRLVIKRFYLEEAEKETICRELGITPIQFAQITSRARQKMKVIFESQGYRRSDFLCIVL